MPWACGKYPKLLVIAAKEDNKWDFMASSVGSNTASGSSNSYSKSISVSCYLPVKQTWLDEEEKNYLKC